MSRLRRLPRVLVSAALPVLFLAAPHATAAAAGTEGPPAVTARLLEPMAHAGPVTVEGQEVPAGLLTLRAATGALLYTYCVEVDHDARPGTRYRETGWREPEAASIRNIDKIAWILRHSYPRLTAGLTARQAHLPEASLTEDDAAAGTQAAIWRLSDGLVATPTDREARDLASWLLRHAGAEPEPAAALSIDPPHVRTRTGRLLGPFRVRNGPDVVDAALDASARRSGVVVTDGKGAALPARVRVAEPLYLRIPAKAAAGSATLTVTGRAPLPAGRVFTSTPYDAWEHSQTMILAASQPDTAAASATARWTAARAASPARPVQPGLAETGGPSALVYAGWTAAGCLLLLVGAALRRRTGSRRR